MIAVQGMNCVADIVLSFQNGQAAVLLLLLQRLLQLMICLFFKSLLNFLPLISSW